MTDDEEDVAETHAREKRKLEEAWYKHVLILVASNKEDMEEDVEEVAETYALEKLKKARCKRALI